MTEKTPGSWGVFFPCGSKNDGYEFANKVVKQIEEKSPYLGVVIKIPTELWSGEWNDRENGVGRYAKGRSQNK
jgi:hypothetical protein